MGLVPELLLRSLDLLRKRHQQENLEERILPAAPPAPRMRPRQTATQESVAAFWTRLRVEGRATQQVQQEIADPVSVERASIYSSNVENYIGTTKLPVGLIGPLRVNGMNAAGDYFVPLATSEAALVASYGRGAEVVSQSGGVAAAVISEGVLRTPAFVFETIYQAGVFVSWIEEQADAIVAAAQATTRHGKLIGLEPFIEVDTVFLLCRFTTGDASGQNMVTVATQALLEWVLANMPCAPRHAFIESNFSGDKKASWLGIFGGRGRKVSASVTVPDAVLRKHLRVNRDQLIAYGRVAGLGAVLSGQLGAQAHYANALAALYIATGQDAACVAESAVGFTRMEPRDDGMFFSVTLPNVLVGTVGGGTGLPAQAAALDIMGLKGADNAKALAEVVAATCLCGEISIIAAIAAGHFTRAHEKLARLR